MQKQLKVCSLYRTNSPRREHLGWAQGLPPPWRAAFQSRVQCRLPSVRDFRNLRLVPYGQPCPVVLPCTAMRQRRWIRQLRLQICRSAFLIKISPIGEFCRCASFVVDFTFKLNFAHSYLLHFLELVILAFYAVQCSRRLPLTNFSFLVKDNHILWKHFLVFRVIQVPLLNVQWCICYPSAIHLQQTIGTRSNKCAPFLWKIPILPHMLSSTISVSV